MEKEFHDEKTGFTDATSAFYRENGDRLLVNEVSLPESYQLSEPIFNKPRYTESDILALEEINNVLDCYLWLSNPYPTFFVEVEAAAAVKERCCEIMNAILLNNGNISTYQVDDQQN